MKLYLEVDSAHKLDDERCVVNVAGVSVVVPQEKLSPSAGSEVPDHVFQALIDIRLQSRVIEDWAANPQPSNLSPQVPSSTAQPVDNSREREARTQPAQVPQPQPDLAPKSEQLFQVNEEVTRERSIDDFAKDLNKQYIEQPKTRRTVIKRVAGMVRLDMLKCKDYFCPELRQAVAGDILRRDNLKTAIVPPDIAAFMDDRPLSETLGSRQWDPGSEKAKDHVSSNWSTSNAVMDEISKKAGDDAFNHMYATTEDMDVQSVASSAKNLFGSKS